jgi:hypothetical protein
VSLVTNKVCSNLAAFLVATPLAATAADLKLIGEWRWQNFTIEVRPCQGDSGCAKIIGGPKNVGMEISASKLVANGEECFGQIVHPETKQPTTPDFSRRTRTGGVSTDAHLRKVCLTGEFVRVK